MAGEDNRSAVWDGVTMDLLVGARRRLLSRELERERQGKISDDVWNNLDVEFVAGCVNEFDAIDPKSTRFRYHADRFKVVLRPHAQPTAELYIDYRALLQQMEHVREVLSRARRPIPTRPTVDARRRYRTPRVSPASGSLPGWRDP